MTTTNTHEAQAPPHTLASGERTPEILVVDDEEHIRDLLERNLQEAGFKTVSADNGSTAIQCIVNRRPDVMLVDLSMPKMDGLELLTKIRQDPATESIPVIVLTAVPPRRAQLKTWKLGVQHYIQKPVTYDRLILTVRVALREAQEKLVTRSENEETLAVDTQRQQSLRSPKSSVLDSILALGTVPRHLTFLYGRLGTGKSVLAQSMAYEAALQQRPVVYITSDVPKSGRRFSSPMAGTEDEVESAIAARMESIGLHIDPMRRDGSFKVAPIDYPMGIPSALMGERAIDGIAKAVELAPVGRSLVVIDDITVLAGIDQGLALVRLMSYIKTIVDAGMSVIMCTQLGTMESRSINNLLTTSDTFLRLAKSGTANALIVQKSESARLTAGMRLKFVVEQGSGIRVEG